MPRLVTALAALVSLVSFGCSGSSSGYLPVDSPLVPFEAPPAEELLQEEPADKTQGPQTPDVSDIDDDWGEGVKATDTQGDDSRK